MLRNIVVHPEDNVKDEEKTELICRVPCSCSSSYIEETGRKFSLRIRSTKKSGFLHSWFTDPILQSKGEQCNLQVRYQRPCCGREPCH